ncbi:hypothetical protein U9M48_000405 [Paspalum notatum var. saurae]|uniref:Integrase zinc-binding domain-containing protein n=1 Tax=Paspalum notatum var. saurae TaxID=547442 RepID=A0AAQ3SI37_PASNO
MEFEPTLEQEIRKGQLNDEKIKEIKELIKLDKAPGFRVDADGTVWHGDRICVPNIKSIRDLILREAHETAYSIHPGSEKMYQDLKQKFWWYGMKREVAEYVALCDVCQRVKAEHQKPAGLLQPLKIPEWKWEEIDVDFQAHRPHACWWTRLWRTQRDRLPTPTPPSPPPQEWVTRPSPKEEDPEELVPEPSEDEPEEEPRKNPWRCSHRTPFGAAAEQPREEPKIQLLTPKTRNKIRMPVTHPHRTMMRTTMKPDPWSPLPTAGSTTRRPLLGCRGKRRRCSTTIARITYVGTRYRHPVLPDDWDMTVEIGIPDEFGSRRTFTSGTHLLAATAMKPPSVMLLGRP